MQYQLTLGLPLHPTERRNKAIENITSLKWNKEGLCGLLQEYEQALDDLLKLDFIAFAVWQKTCDWGRPDRFFPGSAEFSVTKAEALSALEAIKDDKERGLLPQVGDEYFQAFDRWIKRWIND